MTPEQRTMLKQAVSQARLEQVTKAMFEACLCPTCDTHFVRPRTTGQATKRFCSQRCRRLWCEAPRRAK